MVGMRMGKKLQGRTEDLITVEQAGTLSGLFARRLARSPEREAYRAYERGAGRWVSYSWREMGEWVARWQAALAGEGLRPGDRVALQLRNCPQWVMFDQACLGLGLVVVPLYTDDRPDNIAYILRDADVKLLLVQDLGRWRRLAPALREHRGLQRVLIADSGHAQEEDGDPRLRMLGQWLPDSGAGMRSSGGDPHRLASIVYTSGTTGRPKGVMLSHHNMLSVSHAGLTALDVYLEDILLSFLPLSHTLERTAGYYVPMMAGACVAYARSVPQLAEDLQQIRPTLMVAVPRIFERVHGRIREQLAKRPAPARWLFELAVAVGWRRFLHRQRRAGWHPLLPLWPLLERLVAAKIQARLGGRLRMAVSGGAPLSAEIARVFLGLGVNVLQGYGLTETSPQV
ncbi:MAG: long-chain fatty acid--CoA ligase, partial [Candidatus Sedimenticola endophacoides]